jgi:beta-N-acetylhexosaminidase
VTRILALKFKLEAFSRPNMSIVDSPDHRADAAAVAAAAVTVLRGSCSGPLVAAPIRVTSSAGRGQQAQWLTEALTRNGVRVVPDGGSQVHLVGYADGPEDLAKGASVTVAMDTPYLLGSSDSPILVATYSGTQVSMEALAGVIAGTARPTGRSPVGVAGLPATACSS